MSYHDDESSVDPHEFISWVKKVLLWAIHARHKRQRSEGARGF